MDTTPQTDDPKLRLRLKKLRGEAKHEASIPKLQSALDLAGSESNETHDAFANQSLALFIQSNESNKLMPLISYLLSHADAKTSSVTNNIIACSASLELFKLLLAHGWDVNQQDEKTELLKGRRIIDWVLHDEGLVKWLIESGAEIDYNKSDKEDYPVPILETCALFGSFSTFKFLQENGGKLGKRTLHQAARIAASYGADPYTESLTQSFAKLNIDDEKAKKSMKQKVKILKYLVEEVKLDINAADTNVSQPSDRYGYWGTPINYAAAEAKGAKVVKWLLDKGADPRIKTGGNAYDAWACAEFNACEAVLQVLTEWKENHAPDFIPMSALEKNNAVVNL